MQKQLANDVRHRAELRQRTRLRSGKVADIDGNFLADCQIFDRSVRGARLRLAEPLNLADHIKLFDDEYDVLLVAVVIWIDGNDVGIEFPRGPDNVEIDGKEHAALGGRYYALKEKN